MRVWAFGLKFRVEGYGFRFQGLGFRASGLGLRWLVHPNELLDSGNNLKVWFRICLTSFESFGLRFRGVGVALEQFTV